MSLTFSIIGAVFVLISYFCCVLPIVPGPLVAYAGLLLLLLTDHRPSITSLIVTTILVAIACILDYVVPALSAKQFKCSRAGVIGCFLGSIFGFFLGTLVSLFCTIFVGALVLLLALMITPFVGTIIGELCAQRDLKDAFFGGIGSLIGNIVAVGLKLFTCLLLTGVFLWTLFGAA